MKTQHSNYWLDDQYFDEDETQDNKAARLVRLASVRRAVSNFVRILTGRDMPVQFSSGKDSYTDGKEIVISADTNVESYDSMVGLALHEASHVLLTDFAAIDKLRHHFLATDNVGGERLWKDMLHPYIRDKFPPDAYRATIYNKLHLLMNMLEDRRIDRFVYRAAPGYRPYYDALYTKYFFKQEMLKNFQYNPTWREPTFENYINHLLHHFVPGMDHDALPGLRELIKLVDIENIDRVAPKKTDLDQLGIFVANVPWEIPPEGARQYETLPALWRAANELFAVILRYVEIANTPQPEPDTDDGEDASAGGGDGTPSDLPNLDYPSSQDFAEHQPAPDKPKKVNEQRGRKQLEEATAALNHEVKRKKLSAADKTNVSAMEEAEGEIAEVQVADGVPAVNVLVLKRVTPATVKESWFPFRRFGYSGYMDAEVAKGRSMGTMLVQRLQLRNDEQVTNWTRRPAGRIDRRLLASLGANDMNVFYRTQKDTFKPALLHLTLDASGSMEGAPWRKVVTVATALAYVGKNMRNVDVVISLRGGVYTPLIAVLFDSRRDSFATFTQLIKLVGPGGYTPEGLTFKAVEKLIAAESRKYDTYFINFSDGEPAMNTKGTYYGGSTAVQHTRQVVENIRRNGVNVLSYFIGDTSIYNSARGKFQTMYGQDARYVDVRSAHEVLTTLNEKLVATP